MRGDVLFGLIGLLVALALLVLWLWMRPVRPLDHEHDDLRRADDGAEKDPGQGLGSASYWPTN